VGCAGRMLTNVLVMPTADVCPCHCSLPLDRRRVVVPPLPPAKVLAALSPRDRVIALDERGREVSSEGVAQLLAAAGDDGVPLAFCVGGPFGHGPAVLERADDSIRLSKWAGQASGVSGRFLPQHNPTAPLPVSGVSQSCVRTSEPACSSWGAT
jgi:hypothetical protein